MGESFIFSDMNSSIFVRLIRISIEFGFIFYKAYTTGPMCLIVNYCTPSLLHEV